jgi:hypothetical protein
MPKRLADLEAHDLLSICLREAAVERVGLVLQRGDEEMRMSSKSVR